MDFVQLAVAPTSSSFQTTTRNRTTSMRRTWSQTMARRPQTPAH